MPHTTAPATNQHPVLVEVIETRLVWIEAETADDAAEKAPTFVNDQLGATGLVHMPLADTSLEARAVTSDLVDWLDVGPDDVAHLDTYFATHTE